jgi:hypothetical protein
MFCERVDPATGDAHIECSPFGVLIDVACCCAAVYRSKSELASDQASCDEAVRRRRIPYVIRSPPL